MSATLSDSARFVSLKKKFKQTQSKPGSVCLQLLRISLNFPNGSRLSASDRSSFTQGRKWGRRKDRKKKKRLMFLRSLQAKYSQAPWLLQRNP